MMKYIDKFQQFYDQMNDPLTLETLKSLVKIWLKSIDKENGFYERLVGYNGEFYNNVTSSDLYGNYKVNNNSDESYFFSGNKFYRNYKDYYDESTHELYIAVGREMFCRVLSEFIDTCLANEIPFYLRACDSYRNDNIVIYATDNNFFDFLDVLESKEDLMIESLNLQARSGYQPDVGIMQPPLLTGKIETIPWVGYGSRPIDQSAENNYILLRSRFLNLVFSNWLQENNYTKISFTKDLNNELLKDIKDHIINSSAKYDIDFRKFPFNLPKETAELSDSKRLIK